MARSQIKPKNERHNPFTPADLPTPLQKMLVTLQVVVSIFGVGWAMFYFFKPNEGGLAKLFKSFSLDGGGLVWIVVGAIAFFFFFHWFNTTLAKWLPKVVLLAFTLLGSYGLWDIFFK